MPSGTDPAYWFPTEFGYDDNFYRASAFVPPEKVPELMNELSTRGYSHEDIEAIWAGISCESRANAGRPRSGREKARGAFRLTEVRHDLPGEKLEGLG